MDFEGQEPLPPGEGPIQLSGAQTALLDRLGQIRPDLAQFYYGALIAFADRTNPDGIAHAAHGIREVLEKLPRHLDVLMPKGNTTLGNRAQTLREDWDRAKQNSKCYRDGSWSGKIDGALGRAIRRTEEFLSWSATQRPKRAEYARRAIRSLDLSSPRSELRLAEDAGAWQELDDYFKNVSHHSTLPDRADFAEHLATFERYISSRIQPRVFDDFDRIDSIIEEAERDD